MKLSYSPSTRSSFAAALTLVAASVFVAACGTAASDTETALAPPVEGTTTTTTVTTTTKATTPAAVPATPIAARRPAPALIPLAARPVDAARQVTVPAGTTLHLRLNTAVASDTSRVEDAVTAELMSNVMVAGRTVLPAGASVEGAVIGAEDSGRVKGRASLALDFTSLSTGGVRYAISAAPVSRLADATKSEDATKIGIGAGAGAIIGGILGGKKGAAKGAAVGGGAGTGVVLATKGKEVRLASGSDVSTELSAPLTIRIPN